MTNKSMLSADKSIPLCVDLDGTLIRGDTTFSASLKYIGWKSWKFWKLLKIVCLAGWFLKKRHAYMKQKLAEHVTLTSVDWEFIPGMLELLEAEYKAGRKIFLVSATDQKFAQAVADDPRCQKYFQTNHVIASQGATNLRSKAKADYLVKKFGEEKFIYAGNSRHDLEVWKKCTMPVIALQDKWSLLAHQLLEMHPHIFVVSQKKKITFWNRPLKSGRKKTKILAPVEPFSFRNDGDNSLLSLYCQHGLSFSVKKCLDSGPYVNLALY